MPKEKKMKSYTIEEDFVQFTKDSLKMITEKLDMITTDLREIKLKIEVSENERIDLGTIQRNTSLIENFIHKFDQIQNNQQCRLVAMTSTNSTTETNVNTEPVNVAPENSPDEITALSEKQRHIQFWNQNLKFRRIAFWNMMKNAEKAKLYNTWLSSGPTILPRKFQIPSIKGEPENQRVRRERLALEQFKTEIDLLQMRSKYNEDKYHSLDEKVLSFLKTKMSSSVFNILTRMWNDECICEEQKSIQRWLKSETWFQKYETQFQQENRGKNPFMKQEKFQAERDNNRPTGSFENATKPSLKHKSYNTNMYQIPRTYNKFQGRPQIPYHERPYKQSREQRGNINKPKNSFLGYGPRQNQIR